MEAYWVGSGYRKFFYEIRKKMVNEIPQNEQSFLQFVYRLPVSMEPPIEYQFAIHPSGATNSPACSLFALRRATNEYVNRFPKTSEVFPENIYVDNLFNTEENIPALRVYDVKNQFRV